MDSSSLHCWRLPRRSSDKDFSETIGTEMDRSCCNGHLWSVHDRVGLGPSIFSCLDCSPVQCVFGQAVRMNFSVSYQLVGGWAPDNFALFTATVTGFPTMLSIIQNQLITAYVNPENLKADAYVGHRTYFSQPEILRRVPMTVIMYGAMTFVLQLVGYILITNPPQKWSGDSRNSDGRNLETVKDTTDILTSNDSSNKDSNGQAVNNYGSNNVSNGTTNMSENYQSKPTMLKFDLNSIEDFAERSVTTTPGPEDEPKSWKPSETVKTTFFRNVNNVWSYPEVELLQAIRFALHQR
ncbi:oxalate:formate antiporter [Plakobranchus ocellatus]|uniref:Oxalate:formate antiporter n=1 Tax=Plakobranchus ocellatus TaxID=259542 RepID=A0AAV4AHA3_9GAST|nr:oxalate:formate antiporter [Plakobranchus ocellatus]